ncbi:MAG: hypothetical protein D6798_14990 [Deltaproteobacteria bacterium]|nr:MAG: hypothetical protein D6798_14990 [Deltaproteobacteria bacterium]
MSPIPGLPGRAEPSFRTTGHGWLTLDDLVREVVAWVRADGVTLSPYVVKATVQVTRDLVGTRGDDWDAADLFAEVQRGVMRAGVLLPVAQVERIVRVYATLVAMLGIDDVSELHP